MLFGGAVEVAEAWKAGAGILWIMLEGECQWWVGWREMWEGGVRRIYHGKWWGREG